MWAWLRRRVGLLLFLHNVMQIFVAADRRYRPLYNRAVGSQIATQLQLAGYQPDSGIPVVLLSYSGGAQVATGAVDGLRTQLRCPILLITIGGFHNGANDFARAQHLHQLTSGSDRIERVGTWLFPQRWRLFRRSGWNRAVGAGRVTVHRLDPATHVGPRSYISPEAQLPDGRSHLDRTAETVVALVRDCYAPTTGDRRADAPAPPRIWRLTVCHTWPGRPVGAVVTPREHRLATSVLVVGTGGSGLRAAIELAEAGVAVMAVGKRPWPTHTPPSPPAVSTRRWPPPTPLTRGNSMLPTRCWRVTYWPTRERCMVTQNAAHGIHDLERYGMRFDRQDDGGIAALLRRPHLPAHRLCRRLHRPRDATSARSARDRPLDPRPVHCLHHPPSGGRRNRLRRLRLRPYRRQQVPHPRRCSDPRRRWTHPDLAAYIVATRREHRRLVPARGRGRCPAA